MESAALTWGQQLEPEIIDASSYDPGLDIPLITSLHNGNRFDFLQQALTDACTTIGFKPATPPKIVNQTPARDTREYRRIQLDLAGYVMPDIITNHDRWNGETSPTEQE